MQCNGLGVVERTRQHFFTNLLRDDDIVSQDTVNQGKPLYLEPLAELPR